MNGIAGIISPVANPAFAGAIQRMVTKMCHDPEDVAAQCSYNHLGLRVGWVGRERIVKPCIAGWSRRHRVAVVLAGEEFSVSMSGPNGGQQCSGVGAASALAEAYEASGSRVFNSLNGRFCGLLLDVRHDTLILFNDRYGLGRLYYHESPAGFFFGSEAKSLLAALPELRRLDPQGLAELLTVGCVLQNRSLFPGISLLPPGSAWTFHLNGRIERTRYFHPQTWEDQLPLTVPEFGERLRDVFARIGPRYLAGGSRVALSLTGGLDSRAVMAWAKTEPEALPCYTFAGPYRDCADVRIARRLAAACRHPHTTIRIQENFFPDFAALAERTVYVSDGTMDVSGAVELHVNRQARELAPVRLTGNYGSEILRSHVAFRPRRLDLSLFTPEFAAHLRAAAETYRDEAASLHRLTFIAFKQVPWHHYGRLTIEKSQLTPRSPFLDNELVALAFRMPPALAGSARPLLQLIAAGNPSLATIGTDRAFRLKPIPLLTSTATLWQEFTARAEYAYDYGMPRWLARTDHCLSPLRLERLFLGRHKFYHFRVWYRDQLSPVVREHGLATAQPSCFRQGAARQLATEHLSGRGNRTLELHQLLTVRLLERTLIQQP